LPAFSSPPDPHDLGFVGIMTAKMDKLAKNAQVHELHQEMKQSMSELVAGATYS